MSPENAIEQASQRPENGRDRRDTLPALAIRGLRRSFGAVEALAGVDLEVAAGEAVGLMGDNGAGKSTLLEIVAGNLPPDAGKLLIGGRPARLRSANDARQAGVEVVHQDLALCDNLTATENIFLGRELQRGAGPLRWLDHGAMRARAAELLESLGSDARPDELVANLSGGQRQAVAIARTRLSSPRVVLLDEPTAAISVRQVAEVLALIRLLKSHRVAVLLVSHRMPDVFSTCDRIAVLRQGRKVADESTGDTTPERIAGLITGALQGNDRSQPE